MSSSQPHYRGIRPVPRAKAVPEVEAHLRTPGREGQHPPVLVVFGPPGTGKSSLLQELDNDFSQRTPRALIECSHYAVSEIPKLLVQAKFELGRYCPGIGRPRFRRLEIGLAVTRGPIDFRGNPRHAERTLLDLILREISTHPDQVGGTVGSWVDSGTQAVMPSSLRALTTRTVATASRLLSRRLLLRLLRRYLDWYGHRDQSSNDDALDALASLNLAASAPEMHAQRDERLIEALLADIRDLFGRGRLARSDWFNCVLLLDDVDTEVGQEILKHLHQLRLALRIAGTAPEPLLVVATSRRTLGGDGLEQHRLPELTEPETGWLAEYVPGAKRIPGEADHRFHQVLHQFTGGYPAATAFLTDIAYHHPSEASGSLDRLLRFAIDDDSRVVEDHLLDQLTTALLDQPGQPSFLDSGLASLVTCALARTQEEADWLADRYADGFALTPVQLAGSSLWNEEERTSAHELLRRLLLRRLDGGASEQPSWLTICEQLRDRRRELNDLAGELYYALAAGELDVVARWFAVHLDGHGLEQHWLDLLTYVTTAPRADPEPGAVLPYQQQLDLARSVVDDATSRLAQVARLTAGLWLDNDACTHPDREDLHRQLAADYRTLAPDAEQPMRMQREARRHDALAEYWS